MKSIVPRLQRNANYDVNAKVGLFAWIIQMVGMVLIHLVLTGLFGLGAYVFIRISIFTGFWLMIVLSIVFVGISIMGIASIVIDICNIAFLIKEVKGTPKHD